MDLGITKIVENLGLSFETLVVIVYLFGSLIPFAKDFRLGILLKFFGAGCIFAWFYYAGFDYTVVLVIFFIDLIVMSLALYAIAKTTQQGGAFI